MTENPIDFFLPSKTAVKGGKGSGNWGHGGLAGVHGGSSPKRGLSLESDSMMKLEEDVQRIMSSSASTKEKAQQFEDRIDKFIFKHTTMGEDVSKRPEVADFLKRVKDENVEYGLLSRDKNDQSPYETTNNRHSELEITPLMEKILLTAGEKSATLHNHPPNDDGVSMNPISVSDCGAQTAYGFLGKIVSLSRKAGGEYFLSVFQPHPDLSETVTQQGLPAQLWMQDQLQKSNRMVGGIGYHTAHLSFIHDTSHPLAMQIHMSLNRLHRLILSHMWNNSTYYEIPLGDNLDDL